MARRSVPTNVLEPAEQHEQTEQRVRQPRGIRRLAAVLLTALLAASPIVVAPAALAIEVNSPIMAGEVVWGVKESFRKYIEGNIAKGSIAATDGAKQQSDGTFQFPGAAGAYNAAGPTIELNVNGAVQFSGHEGALDLQISNLRISITGDTGLLIADVYSKKYPSGEEGSFPDVALARLDTSRGVSLSANTLTLSKVAATLTQDGAPAFAGFYDAGETLDPISGTFTVGPFRDVSGTLGAPNYSAFNAEITWMYLEKISTGYPVANGQHEYRPFAPVARDAMAAFLYRAAGSPTYTPPVTSEFVDVSTRHDFYLEISWLASQKISTGWDVGGGRKEFRPSAAITRDAMAAFLYRFAGQPTFGAPAASPFVDVSKAGSFYTEITWLASTGVTTGWDVAGGRKAFRPFNPITRDAMAAFLYRFDNLN